MSQGRDELIRFECANGHRLKSRVGHAGRRCRCPACGDISTVPRVDESMTPSAVVRFLDQCRTESHVIRKREEDRKNLERAEHRAMNAECPRCKELIQVTVNVCNHCSLYLGDAERRQILNNRWQSHG